MGRAEISNAVFMQYLRAEIAQGTVTKDSSVVLADTINDTVMVLDTVYTFFRNNDTVITAIRLHRDTNGAYSVADSLKQYPVTGVSWYGAILFCNWLSRQDNLSVCYDTATGMLDTMANGYRLPTEAEYEYVHSAAFLGTKQRYPWGYSENPEKYASFAKGIRAIGSFAPYYGFYDLTGNALEWCHDWSDNTAAADSGYYVLSKAAGVAHDPKGPVTGDVHVLRGGSYRYAGTDNASYYRYLIPTNGYADCGFRVARKSP
jgi:formylglycine-generating enzyme required for sulfatase activity